MRDQNMFTVINPQKYNRWYASMCDECKQKITTQGFKKWSCEGCGLMGLHENGYTPKLCSSCCGDLQCKFCLKTYVQAEY